MPYQTINDRLLYYEEYGDGAPMLMIHGSLSTGRQTFARQISAFKDSFHCIVPDLINHGKSQKTDEQWTSETMADDLADLLEACGIPSVFIISHSMGGDIAMYMAVKYPQKVRALVIISDGVMVNDPITRYLEHLNPAFTEKMTAEYGEYGKKLIQETLRNCAAYPDFSDEELRQVRIPVFLIRGGQDPMVLDTEVDRLRNTLQDFLYYCYDKGDHFLHGRSESYAIVNEQIGRFLQRRKDVK